MKAKLHIVSFDIPYPPDYGGITDVFYKIKSLYDAGIEIILHCYEYGDRLQAPILLSYCTHVFYYKRNTGIHGISLSTPYIVSSRKNTQLVYNLLKDDAPIFLEGIHCTFLLYDKRFKHRYIALRAHNVEYIYYAFLFKNESNIFKKLYYGIETLLLKRYERNMPNLSAIYTVSQADTEIYKKLYPITQVECITSFRSHKRVISLVGTGKYCIYHGNLSVNENILVVISLAKVIWETLEIPLIIAGKNPPQEVIDLQNDFIQIIANPDTDSMQKLIQEAHIQVLPGIFPTGIKLKILNALFEGRYCITNMATGESSLDQCIVFASTTQDYIEKIKKYMQLPFNEFELEKRKELLQNYCSPQLAKKLINHMGL